MRVELRVKQTFEAAHQLKSDAAPKECRRVHGHRYEVEVAVSGEVDKRSGMLVSYEDVQNALARAIEPLDHQFINEAAPDMGEPTTENLCRWLWWRLSRNGITRHLAEIRIQETQHTCCIYRGEV